MKTLTVLCCAPLRMIRKLLDYLTRVKNDESEIDHLWSIHIAKVLA